MATLPPSPFFSSAGVYPVETLVVAPGPQASDAAASGPFDSVEHSALPTDEAAAFPSSPSAAAEITEPPSSTGGCQESPAPGQELCGAGDLDSIFDIGEIFRGARKLNLPRFKLDEQAFMEALEEPPLFLRSAG